MVIGIIGENCSGKSTLANRIKEKLGAEIYTGKDYLRMAKSENEAKARFMEKLRNAAAGEHLIYVIAERDQIKLLPVGAVRILVQADLETIRERFRARMRGNLPEPVAKMLERNHGAFDDIACDLRYDGAGGDPDTVCEDLKRFLR